MLTAKSKSPVRDNEASKKLQLTALSIAHTKLTGAGVER